MSSIGSSPDPRLNRTGLDRLDGQASLDELRRRDQGPGAQQATAEPLRTQAPATEARAPVDAGEGVLKAAAWDGVAGGQRLLPGDLGFEARLGGMDLSAAADAAADAILAAVG